MEQAQTAEMLREAGKRLLFGGETKQQEEGVCLLMQAIEQGDPEAMYMLAKLLLNGAVKCRTGDDEKKALVLLSAAAQRGYMPARAELNRRNAACLQNNQITGKGGRLCGFDGKPIRLVRKGRLTPIDAVLEYRGGKNILTLSANILFLNSDRLPEPAAFEQAVLEGMREWQGEYTVFGGQQLTVKVNVPGTLKLYDSISVMAITEDVAKTMRDVCSTVGTSAKKRQIEDILTQRRSFASFGAKWTVRSRKVIYLQSQTGKFDDLGQIRTAAKHEFGHALGLGDLYESRTDGLEGVRQGRYPELDPYVIGDRDYDLVMCNDGPVSNNDMEMVLLAFVKNRMQLFQKQNNKGEVSDALGKGN